MRAKAAVMYEVNKPLVVEELEVLDPGPHEVRVRFAANGVCHSDLHVMIGDYPYPLPVVLGHEAAGVVDAIGAGVESVKPGDHTQQRTLTGSSFGAGHQRTDVPMLIDLFMDGRYRLRELISRRLPLSEINEAFDLLRQGEVKRSVIVYE
jgi:Zn-dependent alcohol dehydrogenase